MNKLLLIAAAAGFALLLTNGAPAFSAERHPVVPLLKQVPLPITPATAPVPTRNPRGYHTAVKLTDDGLIRAIIKGS